MKTYVVTDKAGPWVAGRRVEHGDQLTIPKEDAEYEVARGLLRPIGEEVEPIQAATIEPLVTREEEPKGKPARKKRGA